jgi:hypothetical protein
MNTLLGIAVAAHGGRDRWRQLTRLTAHARLGGGLWHLKGNAGILDDVHITVDAHRQHVEYSPFRTPHQHSVYEPNRVDIETDDGRVVEARESPRAAFAGHSLQTPWDDLHLIYFAGYAMWTYLTTPFLLESSGFGTREIEPWDENGETWRRLHATFPDCVPSHCREQVFYFDAKGLLRRHDYSVDVIGGSSSGHYTLDHREFGGIVFPTHRRVYALDPNNRPIRERVAIAIDFQGIDVS